MKKGFLFSAIMLVFAFAINAQSDYMYVMKQGNVWGKFQVNDVDSIIFLHIQSGDPITDARDGNVYQTVIIGNQVWMAENLKFLPAVVGPGTGSDSIPYYYVYGYNGIKVHDAKATTNYDTYGVLYNWPAAMAGSASSTANPSGVQGVCPAGWHLPSDDEWMELTDYLGGVEVAGGKLKEIGTTFWCNPNCGATNEAGFTALPGGTRYFGGSFYDIGDYGAWWSATEYLDHEAWNRDTGCGYEFVVRDAYDKEVAFSVRCIMD